MHRYFRDWTGVLVGLALLVPDRSQAEAVDFNRQVRPIFTQHCTACHGGVKAAGGVSFIYRDKAIATGKSGKMAIVPGKADGSELFARITSKDPDEVMPKPDHGRSLNESEIRTLRQWIQEGAVWSEHWSFVPPTEPAEPTLRDSTWAKTKLDRLILSRLEAEGLKPSKPAGAAEWLRRVSLDLIGLPPTLEEFESFRRAAENDWTHAKADAVDRLLASPHFGERWAAVWLDLARYADTYGFEKDPNRDIWPWRDWVIRAFNQDMPFDSFTTKQLAGDLLKAPSSDDLLATAFHRNTQNNTEGGTDDEEYRTAAVIDRVNTTWTAWQATTFGCVQCHSHPYDPIPHADYYRYKAFFDNTDDWDLNDDFPRFLLADDVSRRDEAAALQTAYRNQTEAMVRAGREFVLGRGKTGWEPFVPDSIKTTGGEVSRGKDGIFRTSGTLPLGVVFELKRTPWVGMTALKLEILTDSDDPRQWPERGAMVSHFQVKLMHPDGVPQTVQIREVIPDYVAGPFDPWRITSEDGGGFGGFPVLTGPRWCVLILEEAIAADTGAELQIELKQNIAANSGFQTCSLRQFRLEASTDPAWNAFAGDSARMAARSQWADTRKRLSEIKGVQVPYLVERTALGRRDTRVFIRGNRLTRDQAVEPGIPEVVQPPKDTKARLTRLELAEWMMGERNPLTARVLVNRLWAELFGHGIVETLEDFGSSGAKPTHPELLDHLALRMRMEHGWSIKKWLREVTLSATYEQTGKASMERVQRDPQNRLYARGPRNRLTAEMVRDQALVVSGKFSSKQFGPPVFPPQPEGVWRTVYNGSRWTTSEGADRYRRALYTFVRRTSGYPGFLMFDAPSRDACTARRVPTNTPLQALVTMNDPAFMELAEGLAERMLAAGSDPRAQVLQGCRILTLEEPHPEMVDTLAEMYRSALDEYLQEGVPMTRLSMRAESAAMVLVANTLLNLDQFLVR